MLWFGVFGGTSLFYEQQTSGALYNAFQEGGLSAVVYQLFAYLPGTAIVTFLFLGVSVISFVTAADSNTDVIGGLCSKEVSNEGHTNNRWVKVFWACNIGLLGWLSASFLGDNGIKMLSNLAGLPGMIIVDLSAVSLLILISRLKTNNKPQA